MSTPHRTGSIESTSDSNGRKRVCKACDRCRMKKSKCDGQVPCSRCKVDNMVCQFGERKKTHDKKYPHGYTEMLEDNRTQLIACTRKMYQMLLEGETWPGEPLRTDSTGHPLIHDILERLDLLNIKGEFEGTPEDFEENLSVLREKAEQAERANIRRSRYSRRPHSMSSESELGHYSPSSIGSPMPQSFLSNSLPKTHGLPLTPPTATSIQQFNLPASFKAEGQMEFYGTGMPAQVYVDRMPNASGFQPAYGQFQGAESLFPGDDPVLSPSMMMPTWPELSQADFMDLGTTT